MQLFRRATVSSLTFDDMNLVSAAGPVQAMMLAVRMGLGGLTDRWLTLPGYFAATQG
jgi:hypothetical protein